VLTLELFNVPNDRQPVLEFVQAIFVLGEIARQVRDLRVGVVIGDVAAVWRIVYSPPDLTRA
jgi:hypothetical protein